MHALRGWVDRQVERESRVPRLESALLTNRFGRYFLHRLRFFLLRAVGGSLIRALKVVLIFSLFPREQFLVIIVAQVGATITADLWWGALEQMRSRIRFLQRSGSGHLVPREVGRWLRLALRLTALGLGVAVVWVVVRASAAGGLSVADAVVAAMVASAAIEVTVRAYHSGVYALRRVYRPLPSLLAADVASLVLLVGLWPFVALGAFPMAEIGAGLLAAAISIRYTAQAARLLRFPPVREIIGGARDLPSLSALRVAAWPGLAYAVIGVESIVVLASLGRWPASVSLIVFLAALGPAVR